MADTPQTCVLLAERHHGLSEGVRGLLESEFETVVMVADEASLLEGASRLQPDVAIVDLALAHGDGTTWLAAVRRSCPAMKLIVLSVHDEPSVRREVLRAGADAFVLKRDIAMSLLGAVDAVRGLPLQRFPNDSEAPPALRASPASDESSPPGREPNAS